MEQGKGDRRCSGRGQGSLSRLIREGLIEKVTWEGFERGKRGSYANSWSFITRGNSPCKGPKVGSRNNNGGSEAEAELARTERVRGKQTSCSGTVPGFVDYCSNFCFHPTCSGESLGGVEHGNARIHPAAAWRPGYWGWGCGRAEICLSR